MGKANFRVAGVIALLLIAANFLVAQFYDLPIRDPDGLAVPTYVRLPIIILVAFLLDVVPRAIVRSWRQERTFSRAFASVIKHRWPRSHVFFMLGGLGAWYACYATFRNLKSYVPFVNDACTDKTAPFSCSTDSALASIDRFLFFGNDPAVVLHSLLGTTWAAHFLSFIYIAWIVLIPVTLAVALVWTRSPVKGSWYVTAIAFDWVLGVIVYYMLPTMGPIYTQPENFEKLAHTDVTAIEALLLEERLAVLADPWATQAVQTIAAFASLHVGIMVTICLIAHLTHMPRWLINVSWVFFGLTVVATVYLGWHFFLDTLGGVVLGTLAMYFAAMATGNMSGWRPRLAQSEESHQADFSETANRSE